MASSNKNVPNPVSIDMGKPRQEKFEILVEGLSGDLYRYAYWMCRDRVQAEELVQETFLRAWKGIDSLREADSAKAWLFTIFRREYARQFERKRLASFAMARRRPHTATPAAQKRSSSPHRPSQPTA